MTCGGGKKPISSPSSNLRDNQSESGAQPQLLCNAKAFRNGIDMEITRIFQPGTADQQELLVVLELLLNEPPPATAPTQTACANSHESSPAK